MPRGVLAALFGALVLCCVAIASGSITAVGDADYTFGGSTSSQAMVLPVSPSPGEVEYVTVQLGVTPAPTVSIAPSPSGDAWTEDVCGSTYAQDVFAHAVVSGDGPSIGTAVFSAASGGAIHVALRKGVNTTTPIGSCGAAAAAANSGVSVQIATKYRGSQVESSAEIFATPSPCPSGAGSCNQTGWTEAGFLWTGSPTNTLSEDQYDNTQGLQSYSAALINLSNTGNKLRLLAWEEPASGTLLPWCQGQLSLVGVGC